MPKKVTNVNETNQKKKELPDKIVLNKTVIQQGKYSFTEDEKKDIASNLARKQIDLSLVDDERKSIMSDYKDRLDKIKLDINQLSRHIIDGFEFRDFECKVTRDFKAHSKVFHDVRTGKEVYRCPLDPHEYQLELGV